ncbi:MAG: maleate cis-trans isomerase family protein [Phreatobacter sp.]
MASPIRLGMLTPSSNTVLEPVTAAMLAGLHDITVHFSRFQVTEIALDARALGQFDDAPVLRAAELLAHAKVDVIAWNGTSAGWLGLDRDRRLVERIEAATGIPAATCVLGYFELFRRLGIRRLGLASPYLAAVQSRICEVFAGEGITTTGEHHLGLRDNFSFATVSEAEIETMFRALATARPDAIVLLCTNMRGAGLAARLEAELAIPILDSVAVTLWACLERLGLDRRPLHAWGRLFAA